MRASHISTIIASLGPNQVTHAASPPAHHWHSRAHSATVAPARTARQCPRRPSQDTLLPARAGGSRDLRRLHWSGAPDGRPWPPSPACGTARRRQRVARRRRGEGGRAGAAASERAHLHVALLPRVLAAADHHGGLIAPEKEGVTCAPPPAPTCRFCIEVA